MINFDLNYLNILHHFWLLADWFLQWIICFLSVFKTVIMFLIVLHHVGLFDTFWAESQAWEN